MKPLLPAILAAISATPAAAQILQPYGDPLPGKAIELEIMKPSFDGGDFTFTTSADFLAVRWPVSARTRLVGEVPFVHASPSGSGTSSDLLGNFYVGLRRDGAPGPGGSWSTELGVRLPTANVWGDNDFAILVGLFSAFQRYEAVLDDTWAVRLAGTYRKLRPDGLAIRAGLGSVLLLPGGDAGGDSELFADYGLQVGYEQARYQLGAAFTGRAIITEGNIDFGERTQHDLAFGASTRFGRFHPGVYVRIPLDDELNDLLNHVLGLRLAVAL